MVDLMQYRMARLAQMSGHWRQLAGNSLSAAISGEIGTVADDLDQEIARMRRECVGKRSCPCEYRGACLHFDDEDLGDKKNIAIKMAA